MLSENDLKESNKGTRGKGGKKAGKVERGLY